MKQSPVVSYLKDSFEELTKVVWPTKNQAIRISVIVIVFCLIAALALGILDYILNLGYKELLNLNF